MCTFCMSMCENHARRKGDRHGLITLSTLVKLFRVKTVSVWLVATCACSYVNRFGYLDMKFMFVNMNFSPV